MVLHMYRETIKSVPFLKEKDPHFVVAMVRLLHLQYFAPGDVVVRQGEDGHSIFFVTLGILEVRVQCLCLVFGSKGMAA
jgi:signal-transduction protein with cAMP-binding, CBS, and nucleotidyltransferase domain